MQRGDLQQLLGDKYRIIERLVKNQKKYASFVVQKLFPTQEQTKNNKKYIAKIQDLAERRRNKLGKLIMQKKPRSSLVLQQEIQILLDIQRNIDKIGFPKAYDVYSLYERRVIITDLRSLKLSKLIPLVIPNLNSERYIKLCLKIIYDLLDRIQAIHKANYIHNYLRPEFINFKRQFSKNQTLFISDYLKAHKYNEYNIKKQNYHKPYSYFINPTGKNGFSSIWSHSQIAPSRRDDMESLCYIAIYLLNRGQLPWNDLTFGDDPKKDKQIFQKKLTILDSDIFESQTDEPDKQNTFQALFDFMQALSSRSQLTSKPDQRQWKVLRQFKQILTETRNLSFEEQPNYHYTRKLIKKAMNRFDIIETQKYHFPIPQNVLYPMGV